MEGIIAAVQPYAGVGAFIVLMLLMHGLHGGHGGHSQHGPNPRASGPARRDETAVGGAHQHD